MLYFSEVNHRGNHAGTKARNDAEKILWMYGAKPVNTKILELREQHNGIQSNIANRLGFLRYYLDLLAVKNQIVIIQYPMLAFDIQYEYVSKLAKRNRVVFLVHDIQSMRRNDAQGLEREIRMLNLAYGLIVHNRFMEEKLIGIGVQAKHFYRLNCFDYLYAGELEAHHEQMDVAFAGNLEKSTFLQQMSSESDTTTFCLYGPGWNPELAQKARMKYMGSFSPDEIPGKLQGKYGLVWDGDTTAGCTGLMGEYTRINNPHKMSLYLAAGIPVIVWKEAAIAEFVEKNGVGIVTERIDDLQKTLGDITQEQYQAMQQNVNRVRKRLIDGGFLRAVLGEIEKGASQ